MKNLTYSILLFSVPDLEYNGVFDQPQMYQVLSLIKKAGPRGLSQVELRKIMNLSRLAIRRFVKFLERGDFVDTVMQDSGRQKVIM